MISHSKKQTGVSLALTLLIGAFVFTSVLSGCSADVDLSEQDKWRRIEEKVRNGDRRDEIEIIREAIREQKVDAVSAHETNVAFKIGGVITVVVVVLLVLVIFVRNVTTKECPSCAERIKKRAQKCRYCGNSMPEEKPVSEENPPGNKATDKGQAVNDSYNADAVEAKSPVEHMIGRLLLICLICLIFCCIVWVVEMSRHF